MDHQYPTPRFYKHERSSFRETIEVSPWISFAVLDTFTNYCVDGCSSSYDHYCQGEPGLLFFAIERNNTGLTTTLIKIKRIINANVTAITSYDNTTQTGNGSTHIKMLVLTMKVWVRKPVSTQTTEETSSNRESSRMSNYDTISLNTIPHPIHKQRKSHRAVSV
ncbi:unnamed protein product [Mytilus edulis]|uniref:Uncharacterized protein n=1 Tax=Mytilus edulis TaxID=6550 RepID=A0A8S3RNA4_MYTED|nr:unnamed protein product [Mytilus edulis]